MSENKLQYYEGMKFQTLIFSIYSEYLSPHVECMILMSNVENE